MAYVPKARDATDLVGTERHSVVRISYQGNRTKSEGTDAEKPCRQCSTAHIVRQ